MKTLLLILATLISFTAFGRDEAQTTTRYRYNSVITIDPTVQIQAEDGSWTNTAKTLGYLSLVTSDIQTQLNSKTNSVISGAALNLTNRANEFYGDQFTGTNFIGKLTGVASQATHATNADLATLATTATLSTNAQIAALATNAQWSANSTNANLATLATTAITSTNVQGFSLTTNNLVTVTITLQKDGANVTNAYLSFTTNAIHYLGN
jgi:hypothetical protein